MWFAFRKILTKTEIDCPIKFFFHPKSLQKYNKYLLVFPIKINTTYF